MRTTYPDAYMIGRLTPKGEFQLVDETIYSYADDAAAQAAEWEAESDPANPTQYVVIMAIPAFQAAA